MVYLVMEAVDVTAAQLFGKLLSQQLSLPHRLQSDRKWLTLKNCLNLGEKKNFFETISQETYNSTIIIC